VLKNRLMPETGILVILPEDINTERHFFDAFDNSETEGSASWIVRFCQQGNRWVAFSEKEIEAFYNSFGNRHFPFNRLIGKNPSRIGVENEGAWIVRGEDSLYRVTIDFVMRCYNSSPKYNVDGK